MNFTESTAGSPRKLASLLLLAAGGLLIGTACNEQSFTPTQPTVDDLEAGSVSGRVCDPVALTWLEGAQVYTQAFDAEDIPYATIGTITDADGRWQLDDLLPSERNYDIYVQYGYEILETHSVRITSGETVALGEPECFDPLDVAVITGDYDDLGNLLGDLGVYTYDTVEGTTSSALVDFLSSLDSMEEYDVILFNGGHVEEDVIFDTDGTATAQVAANLENIRRFVSNGGMIYATDWSYDIVEQIWPDKIDFLGDDTIPEDAQVGETGIVQANVIDPALAEYIGTDKVEVDFDLPVWPPMESVSGDVVVHLQTGSIEYAIGDDVETLSNVPLLVSFSEGPGKVVFSSYRLSANDTPGLRDAFGYLVRGDEG